MTRYYWTAYNEIDRKIYDGTAVFDSREDAEDWLGGQPFICRPSTKIVEVKITYEDPTDFFTEE